MYLLAGESPCGEAMKHEKECPAAAVIQQWDAQTSSCEFCEAIRGAVVAERESCIAIRPPIPGLAAESTPADAAYCDGFRDGVEAYVAALRARQEAGA